VGRRKINCKRKAGREETLGEKRARPGLKDAGRKRSKDWKDARKHLQGEDRSLTYSQEGNSNQDRGATACGGAPSKSLLAV